MAAINPAAPMRPSNCSSVRDLREAVGMRCVVTGYSKRLKKRNGTRVKSQRISIGANFGAWDAIIAARLAWIPSQAEMD
jgi:hypothetical protein